MIGSLKKDLGSDLQRYLAEKGHVLLLTPPRMSTWQPIELYWASRKNQVAKLVQKGRGLVEAQIQLETTLMQWGTGAHCYCNVHCPRNQTRQKLVECGTKGR
jgi:hypothetical protein